MAGFSRIAMAVAAALLLTFLRPAPAWSGDARLMVYLEVPRGVGHDVVLRPSAFALVTDPDTLMLALERRELSSRELSGRQVRLVDQSVPPGVMHALLIRYAAIEGTVGQARVFAQVPDGGTRIPLNVRIEANTVELIALRWRSQPIDETPGPYEPRIEPLDVEVPPLGSLAFVSNEGSNSVAVVDRLAQRVVGAIFVGEAPRGLAYSRHDQKLYVALAGSDEIAVIQGQSQRLLRRLPLGSGDNPTRLLLPDREDQLYVLNTGSSSVTVLTTDPLQEAGRIPVGERPHSLADDRRTGFLYVASELTGRILVYDPRLQREVTSIAVDSSPLEVLFADRESQLFVTSSTRRRLMVIDTNGSAVVPQLTLCSNAQSLAYNPTSGRLYAGIGDCKEISISLPDQSLEVGSIRLPDRPGLMAFDSKYRTLMVTLPASHQLASCDVNRAKLTSLVDVGHEPYAVVIP
jgi:YVTN family beta-propeller protein